MVVTNQQGFTFLITYVARTTTSALPGDAAADGRGHAPAVSGSAPAAGRHRRRRRRPANSSRRPRPLSQPQKKTQLPRCVVDVLYNLL